MVLRCSLLGHDYGEPDVEREREERGSEVVVTVQEYEECSRCGERNVLSENTEVRSLSGTSADAATPQRSESERDAEPNPTATDQSPQPGADQPGPAGSVDAGSGGPGGVDTGGESAPATDATDATGDAEIIDAEADSADGVTIPDAETDDPVETRADPVDEPASSDDAVGPVEQPTDGDDEPVTDDGEILTPDDDASGEDDRSPGAWPDSSDVGPPVEDDDPTTWPDPEADADGADDDAPPAAQEADEPAPGADDATEEETDAVVLEHTDPTETGADAIATDSEIVDAGPAADADSGSEPRSTDQPTLSGGSGIERADSVPTPGETAGRRTDDVPTEFYCPRCEFVATGDRGSLRAGDICPDCRKGYLGERPVQ